MKTNLRNLLYSVLIVGMLIALDQVSKHLAVVFLKSNRSVALVPGILELFYLENRGAAFGMLKDHQEIFIIFAVLMFGISMYCVSRLPKSRHYLLLKIIFLLCGAGAVGNMMDRIIHHYVIDFIYLSIIHFPIFNLADCYICIAAVLAVIALFTVYRNDDFTFLKPEKKGY